MKNKLLILSLLVATCGMAFAQQPAGQPAPDTSPVTFRFVPGKDMFYIPWQGNGAELNRLYALVDEYRAEITAGRMPLYVNGYSAGKVPEPGFHAGDNLKIAAIRSNRVKSELITHKGLVEDNFITKNHATAYTAPDGAVHKDMVVVTLHVPVKTVAPKGRLEEERARELREAAEQAERERQAQAEREREQVARKQAERERAAAEQAERDRLGALEAAADVKPYCLAVRTNLLYDAFLLPTLGLEWRISNNIGIKLDGSRSWWGNRHGKVQKVWLLSPEVRWYLGQPRRLYVGAAGNFGEYNIYKAFHGLSGDDTGYQGKLWGAGLTVGYVRPA